MSKIVNFKEIEHIRRNLYYIKCLDIHIPLSEKASLSDLYTAIYEAGKTAGNLEGRKFQSQQILDIINKPFENG